MRMIQITTQNDVEWKKEEKLDNRFKSIDNMKHKYIACDSIANDVIVCLFGSYTLHVSTQNQSTRNGIETFVYY